GGKWRFFTTADGLPHDKVHVLAEDAAGLWAGTAGGLARTIKGAAAHFEASLQDPALAVRSLLIDRHGALWAGTADELLRISAGAGGVRVVERDAFGAPVVTLLEDREGSLWIGTDGNGLTRLRAGPAITFGAAQGLADLQVYAVAGDPMGDLWAGTNSGAVFRLHHGEFIEAPSPTAQRSHLVRSLLVARDDALWIGSDHGLFRRHGGRFTEYGPAQGLPPFSIRALAEDAAGTLWVGTEGGGLARLAGGRFEVLTERDGLAGNQVLAIHPARRGGLWIGTYGGLSLLRGGRFTNYTMAQGLPTRLVRTLLEDADGTLWIGTYGGGLARLRDGRITTYRRRDGLLSDVIFQILDDGRGRLWMTCNLGVFRIERRQLQEFAEGRRARLDSRVFGKADGMGSRECNGGKPGGWRTADGRLWFATVAGLVMFDPAREPRNEAPPPVAIEGALADGEALSVSEPAVLAAGSRRIELFFTALSFVAPERNRLRYRLEGFDDEWLEAGADRRAVYTQLAPGAYRFRVIAANSDGVWNDEGASFGFRIEPFFYQTGTFYLLVFLVVVLVPFGVYALRTRQLRARERELRRRVEEATARLKVLSGLLPICASCKKIRGDGGYWQQLEAFIRDHSEAEFSHGICPDCAGRLYPDLDLSGVA
ncbi:MAG: ligand-binding sensor domain-containing protein, partial [Thermoanaerobaculia bacterium]